MKKKMTGIALLLVLCLICSVAAANTGWVVPSGNSSGGTYSSESSGFSMDAKLIDDLATRSGPSTQYTGCGYYQMKGQKVRAISRAFDNGGVQWVQIDFEYDGAIRRAYTGAQRLNLTTKQLAQLPEEDLTEYIGYGTINANVNPKWGPGEWYTTYTDRTMRKGARVAVINYDNGYYMVESYHTDGNVLRSWVPSNYVNLD